MFFLLFFFLFVQAKQTVSTTKSLTKRTVYNAHFCVTLSTTLRSKRLQMEIKESIFFTTHGGYLNHRPNAICRQKIKKLRTLSNRTIAFVWKMAYELAKRSTNRIINKMYFKCNEKTFSAHTRTITLSLSLALSLSFSGILRGHHSINQELFLSFRVCVFVRCFLIMYGILKSVDISHWMHTLNQLKVIERRRIIYVEASFNQLNLSL